MASLRAGPHYFLSTSRQASRPKPTNWLAMHGGEKNHHRQQKTAQQGTPLHQTALSRQRSRTRPPPQQRPRPAQQPILALSAVLKTVSICADDMAGSTLNSGTRCLVEETEARQGFGGLVVHPDFSIRWQGQRESNPQPSVLETDALPIELYPYRLALFSTQGAEHSSSGIKQ
jgi:hypothetical protein